MRRSTSETGFTILEITVVALIVSLVMILAATLMLESAMLSRDAMRPITRTHLGLSEATLRQDLSGGRRIGDSLLWSAEPLILSVDGVRIEYTVEEGRLRRTDTSEGTVRDLAPVRSMVWRSVDEGTWVQLAPASSSNEAGGRRFVRWPSPVPETLFVAPRRPRGRGW